MKRSLPYFRPQRHNRYSNWEEPQERKSLVNPVRLMSLVSAWEKKKKNSCTQINKASRITPAFKNRQDKAFISSFIYCC